MSFEMDFLVLAASVFNLLVLVLLPLTAIVIFLVYMKKILMAWMEARRRDMQKRTARRP